jgi:hypothetical protein
VLPGLPDLPPSEADRLKKRFDLWREAMDRLKAEPTTPTGDEPLFPSELENST